MHMITPFLVTPAASSTRASTATYLDAGGVLRYAAVDEVRPIIETTGATNYIINSSSFSVYTNSTLTSSSSPKAPNASANCSKLTDNSSTGTHSATLTTAVSMPASTVAGSIFLRQGTAYRAKVVLTDSTGAIARGSALIDLVNKTVVSSSGLTTISLENCTDSWVRVKFTDTLTGGNTCKMVVYLDSGSGNAAESTSYTGASNRYIYMWGAQLEDGTSVSSYIPTSGATVTRAPDVPPAAVAGVSDLLSSDIPINDYSAWSVSTAYTTGQRVIVTGYTDIYECVTGNTGTNPATDTTGKWLNIGKVNRWKMFDSYMSTSSSQATAINVSIRPGAKIDSIVLFGVKGQTAKVTAIDEVEGEFYQKEVVMMRHYLLESSWWAYFFESVPEHKDIVVFDDIPHSSSCTITIQISAPGGTAECGMCLLGKKYEIGKAQWDAVVGINDYSNVSRDAFGNANVVERAYSDKAHFQVYLPTEQITSVKKLLTSRRAKPTVFIGDENYESTVIYGFPTNFEMVFKSVDYSDYDLTVEGLT